MVQQSSHVILSANRSQVGWTNISGHSFVDWKPCRSSRRAHTRCATPWSRSRWSPWLAVLVEGSRDDGPISWNMVAIFLGNMIRYAAYHKADCTIPLRSSDHQIHLVNLYNSTSLISLKKMSQHIHWPFGFKILLMATTTSIYLILSIYLSVYLSTYLSIYII